MPLLVGPQNSTSGKQDYQDEKKSVTGTKTLNFTAIATDLDEEWEEILQSPELPQAGGRWNGYRVRTVTPTSRKPITYQNRATMLWDITVELAEDEKPENPEEWPPEVSWDSEVEEVHCGADVVDGRKVENTAGEPLVLTRPQTVTVLSISRYYKDFPPSWIFLYTNTVSVSEFWGAPAQSARMEKISIAYEGIEVPQCLAFPTGGKHRFAKVSYTIKVRDTLTSATPWKASLLNFGSRCRPANGKPAQRALDVQGHPIEVKLDANGLKLGENAQAIYLDFNVYPLRDWSPLGISQTECGF
ncbi:MAG: hypothetical protein Q4C70_08580 [Planctomycetia bacterium]|nr:hypothetical protein [Planctomycetia bacterium]